MPKVRIKKDTWGIYHTTRHGVETAYYFECRGNVCKGVINFTYPRDEPDISQPTCLWCVSGNVWR